jgi:hypothetical protein
MQDQPLIAFKSPRNPLSHAPQVNHAAALQRGQWRLEGPQQKGMRDPGGLELRAQDAQPERLNIDCNIR